MKKLLLVLIVAVGFSPPATADAGADAKVVTASTDARVVATGEVVLPDGGMKPDAAVAPKEPTDPKSALATGEDAYRAAKDGRWWYFASLVVTLIMFLLKFVGKKVGFWPKLGRWRYVISPILSIGAALLAAFQGGVSIEIAIGVLTSSYATSSLQELWEHGVLGKPRASAGG